MTKDELSGALEKATGADDDLDLALAEWAQAKRIPMPPPYYDGGPINYDPRLWLERHDWQPTASIDAALTLRPDSALYAIETYDSNGVYPEHVRASAWVQGAARAFAATPALAICIAALKARHD